MKAQQLRNAVLQLAVQGKLVLQDPSDEPASVLLERVKAEKEQLIREKKIKPEKPLPEITEEEKPFDIPDSWEWVRLGDICEYIQRGKSPKYSEKQKIPVISQKCVQWSGFSIEKAKFIDPETIDKYGEERLLKDNDLLWNSTGLGTLGRIVPYIQNANPFSLAVADSHITVIRTVKQYINPIYVYNYLSAPVVQSVIEDKAEGSTKQKELYTQTIKDYITPLPPLAEQERIVAKIEEIMPLIDKYEKLETELSKLEDDFPKNLKKSILQYAVQGKLMEQNKDDEPASILIEKIKAEKEQLIKDNKIKREKLLTEIMEEEKPFDIPDNWEWVRINEVFNFIDYRGKTPNKINSGVPLITASNIKSGFMDYTKKDYISRAEYEKRQTRGISQKGDLLFTTEAPLGNAALADLDEYSTGQRIICLQKYCLVDNCFFMYSLLSDPMQKLILSNSTGTTAKGIKGEKFKMLLIPLPPLEEQKRIVARVDKLIALCDVLEDEIALNNYKPAQKANNIIEFKPKLVQQDEESAEEFDMVARAESISPETQAKIAERIKSLRTKR